LARYLRRYDSADRHAQYWRRVAREVIAVACALDHGEDPSGYIPGVSSGPWEVWARDWLGRGLLAVPPGRRDIRNWLRDLRRLGVPKWLRRSLAIVRGWRTAPYNGR